MRSDPAPHTPARATAQARDKAQQRLRERTRELLERPRAAPDPEAAAREKAVVHECRYLMRLLATRRRSAGELRQRLEQREVPAAIAHEAMARIDRAGLVDDAAFAREWVAQRRELRALSDEALRRELQAREVQDAHIDQALAIGGAGDEEQRCRDLVRARLRPEQHRLRDDPEGAHRRRMARRLDALLTRKGYPGDLAVRVISSELRDATAHH